MVAEPTPRSIRGGRGWMGLAAVLLGLAVGWWWGRASLPVVMPVAGPGIPEELLIEAREARLAAAELASQNADLQRQAEGLQAQVRQLAEQAAGVRAQEDAGRVAAEKWRTDVEPGSETVTRTDAKVVDVNARLRMVVADAGYGQGWRRGMRLKIVRGDAVIAEARATEVRKAVTGAALQQVEPGVFPVVGDRVVLGGSAD